MLTTEKLEVDAIRITGAPALDPITVIFQDFGPGQGKIIIECFSEAWAAYWGGMGNRTLREFFASCDDSYLFKNLWPATSRKTRDTKHHEGYLMRIIAAVKAGIASEIKAASATPYAPHQQRVVEEKTELDGKLAKLKAFIDGNAIFAGLPSAEQERLVRQHASMTEYSAIIGERIAAFPCRMALPGAGEATVSLHYRDGSNYKCAWDVHVDDAVARNLGPPDNDGFHNIAQLGLTMQDIPLVAEYGQDQDDHPFVTVTKITYDDGTVYEPPEEAQ